MSDPESSGAATSAAGPASTPSTPPNPTPPPSAFSNNRGSGLARGKRPASQPVQAASAAPAAEYKPTAVSIVTAPTEYKNPFAPPAPVAAPVEAAPAVADLPPPTPAPVPAPLPATPVAEAPAPVRPATSEPVRIPYEDPVRIGSSEPEPMPELKILPPETTKRVEHNWESESFRNVANQPAGEPGRTADAPRPPRDDRRNERPVFRPERDRRDDRPADPRAQARPAWNEQGRSTGNESSPAEFTPPPKTEAPKKSGGFFAWLRKLFSGATAAPKPETPSESRGEREYPQEGQYRRRRRRGGRGRHFQGDQRDPRDSQSGGQPGGDQRRQGGDQRGYGGEQRGYGGENRHHGHRRRPHGGGGYHGNGRPEGGPPSGS